MSADTRDIIFGIGLALISIVQIIHMIRLYDLRERIEYLERSDTGLRIQDPIIMRIERTDDADFTPEVEGDK